MAVFAIPAPLVAGALKECGEKEIPGAVLIPSGFAETGNVELQDQIVAVAREYNVRLMGPNIYGFYYTHKNLCATFCTPYDVKGKAALSSQSGGVGMAIIGFSRSAKMGVSAIVGLGNKSDIDEDDLLTFFEQDPNTQVVAMHVEDLKDGRSFAEVARRVSKKKAGDRAQGRPHRDGRARRAIAYRGAGRQRSNLRRRAAPERRGARDEPQRHARVRAMPADSAHAQGRERPDHHRRGRLGRAALRRLRGQRTQADGDAAGPRRGLPQVYSAVRRGGQSGRYNRRRAADDLSATRSRWDSKTRASTALILGYWHTIITPPMVFAKLASRGRRRSARASGIDKPVVASLVGDVEVEQASAYLFDHGIPAYSYTTEKPVAVLGAKYRWARAAGLL